MNLTNNEICNSLGPLLTEARKARVEEVLTERTLNVATVVEHIYDIGNISAVMRSAESFGFMPFHIIERPEAKYKKSDRISKGSEKWLDIYKSQSGPETFKNLKDNGYEIWATTLEDSIPIEQVDFSKKVAVVFGNEKDGVSEEALKYADGRFAIPMRGFTQSFNISVAAALTYYHIHLERTRIFGKSGDLTDNEKEAVRARYYQKTLQNAPTILAELANLRVVDRSTDLG